MGKALYRKYRSKKLSEIVGQEHITTTLSNALKSGNISHAYLLTGPRGVGKTSIARILAHEVNDLPYEDDAIHLDIIEIDAASNRRIDEIRELRERVHNAPTSAKYKVYIIDEVHMLTREAFNALLKTLEEPPAHAIFILATTEAHKLPETIISRTQRFSFKPIDTEKAVGHLREIAKTEKFIIDDAALELIAEHGGGSFRDSISLLDQVASGTQKVALKDVIRVLGIASGEAIDNLKNIVASGTPGELVALLEELKDQGYHAGQLAKQLAGKLRQDLLDNKMSLEAPLLTKTLEKLLAVTISHEPATALELALLGTVLERSDLKIAPTSVKAEAKPLLKAKPAEIVQEQPTTKKEERPVSTPKTSINFDELWHSTLNAIKTTHNTLYSVARMAKCELNGAELTLAFGFPFHQKRMSEVKNRAVLEKIIKDLSGKDIKIICTVDKNQKEPPAIEKPELKPNTSGALGNISNIFGGAEIVE